MSLDHGNTPGLVVISQGVSRERNASNSNLGIVFRARVLVGAWTRLAPAQRRHSPFLDPVRGTDSVCDATTGLHRYSFATSEPSRATSCTSDATLNFWMLPDGNSSLVDQIQRP
jgi:hypothetical protein